MKNNENLLTVVFPGTPMFVPPMTDDDWNKLQLAGNLPDSICCKPEGDLPECISVVECRALLDRIIENAALRRSQFVPGSKLIKKQLGKLKNSEVSTPLNDVFQSERLPQYMSSLLKGYARLLENRPLVSYGLESKFDKSLATSTSVTSEMKVLAAVALNLGAGSRPTSPNGGSHDPTEGEFLSELLNFWRDWLGREVTVWVNLGHKPEPKGSPLVEFTREAFRIAGVRYAGTCRNSIHMTGRIHRAVLKMNKAEKAGLEWNILARTLNKH